ncbi:unnamed protein product [Rotaria socialis]
MAHTGLPAHLFKSLHLPNPENYNVYLVGSRLWGTNTTTSDWDLLIVGNVPSNQLTSLHKAQYDITLLDRQEFIARVKEGSIIEVICALMRAIKTWLEARQIKDFEKAEKFWLKGNLQPAWKILRHILHATALYNHLVIALQKERAFLTIDNVQTIVRSATFLCDKTWMQLDWSNVHAAVIDALTLL